MSPFLIEILAIIASIFVFWMFFVIFRRRTAKEAKWVTICPKCGSIDVIKLFLSDRSKKFLGFLNPNTYKCNSCGYEGIFPEADVSMLNEIQKKIREKRRIARKTR